MKKPTNIKALQSRSRDLTVRRIGTDTFIVESATQSAAQHIVSVRFDDNDTVHSRCTCDWAKFHGVGCAHVMAALEYLAAQKGRTLSFWLTPQDAKRQRHRTFYLAGGSKDDGIWITSRNDLDTVAAGKASDEKEAMRERVRERVTHRVRQRLNALNNLARHP